jgi:hypothetical protein
MLDPDRVLSIVDYSTSGRLVAGNWMAVPVQILPLARASLSEGIYSPSVSVPATLPALLFLSSFEDYHCSCGAHLYA